MKHYRFSLSALIACVLCAIPCAMLRSGQNFGYSIDPTKTVMNWRKDLSRNITETFGYDNLSYNALQRPSVITENSKSATFFYGHDYARRKMEIRNGAGLQYTRYYLGDCYEKDVKPDNTTTERLYLGGTAYKAPAVYVRTNGGAWTLYYIHRDHLGSITGLSNTSGALAHEYSYDPWGRLRNPANHIAYLPDQAPELFLGRGFTGHEHLPQFGLINMNARLYDPVLGRFLSPDPYVQAPDFSQSFNRYSYCLNNPLMYVDQDGELFGLDDLIGFVVGGVINLVSNAIQGNIHNIGDGLAAFAAGGVAGALATYGPVGWAAGGAIVGATNAWLGGAKGWDIVKGAGIGAVSGIAGGAAGQWAAQSLGGVVINGLHVTSPVLQGAIGGIAGGAAGGYVGGFTAGLLITGDFEQANKAGLSGMISGAPIGGLTGSIGGYAAAKKAGMNPWTGKPNETMVYRVVSESELIDIQNNGIRVNPDGTGYQDGKLFYPSYEEALKGQSLFQKSFGQTSTIIEVTYPAVIIKGSYHFQPDGMNAIMIDALKLNQSIKINYK